MSPKMRCRSTFVRGPIWIHLSTLHPRDQQNLCIRIKLPDQLVSLLVAIDSEPAGRHLFFEFGFNFGKVLWTDRFRIPFRNHLVALATNHSHCSDHWNPQIRTILHANRQGSVSQDCTDYAEGSGAGARKRTVVSVFTVSTITLSPWLQIILIALI